MAALNDVLQAVQTMLMSNRAAAKAVLREARLAELQRRFTVMASLNATINDDGCIDSVHPATVALLESHLRTAGSEAQAAESFERRAPVEAPVPVSGTGRSPLLPVYDLATLASSLAYMRVVNNGSGASAMSIPELLEFVNSLENAGEEKQPPGSTIPKIASGSGTILRVTAFSATGGHSTGALGNCAPATVATACNYYDWNGRYHSGLVPTAPEIANNAEISEDFDYERREGAGGAPKTARTLHFECARLPAVETPTLSTAAKGHPCLGAIAPAGIHQRRAVSASAAIRGPPGCPFVPGPCRNAASSTRLLFGASVLSQDLNDRALLRAIRRGPSTRALLQKAAAAAAGDRRPASSSAIAVAAAARDLGVMLRSGATLGGQAERSGANLGAAPVLLVAAPATATATASEGAPAAKSRRAEAAAVEHGGSPHPRPSLSLGAALRLKHMARRWRDEPRLFSLLGADADRYMRGCGIGSSVDPGDGRGTAAAAAGGSRIGGGGGVSARLAAVRLASANRRAALSAAMRRNSAPDLEVLAAATVPTAAFGTRDAATPARIPGVGDFPAYANPRDALHAAFLAAVLAPLSAAAASSARGPAAVPHAMLTMSSSPELLTPGVSSDAAESYYNITRRVSAPESLSLRLERARSLLLRTTADGEEAKGAVVGPITSAPASAPAVAPTSAGVVASSRRSTSPARVLASPSVRAVNPVRPLVPPTRTVLLARGTSPRPPTAGMRSPSRPPSRQRPFTGSFGSNSSRRSPSAAVARPEPALKDPGRSVVTRNGVLNRLLFGSGGDDGAAAEGGAGTARSNASLPPPLTVLSSRTADSAATVSSPRFSASGSFTLGHEVDELGMAAARAASIIASRGGSRAPAAVVAAAAPAAVGGGSGGALTLKRKLLQRAVQRKVQRLRLAVHAVRRLSHPTAPAVTVAVAPAAGAAARADETLLHPSTSTRDVVTSSRTRLTEASAGSSSTAERSDSAVVEALLVLRAVRRIQRMFRARAATSATLSAAVRGSADKSRMKRAVTNAAASGGGGTPASLRMKRSAAAQTRGTGSSASSAASAAVSSSTSSLAWHNRAAMVAAGRSTSSHSSQAGSRAAVAGPRSNSSDIPAGKRRGVASAVDGMDRKGSGAARATRAASTVAASRFAPLAGDASRAGAADTVAGTVYEDEEFDLEEDEVLPLC